MKASAFRIRNIRMPAAWERSPGSLPAPGAGWRARNNEAPSIRRKMKSLGTPPLVLTQQFVGIFHPLIGSEQVECPYIDDAWIEWHEVVTVIALTGKSKRVSAILDHSFRTRAAAAFGRPSHALSCFSCSETCG